ncbi:MAG: SCE4755 family polysaccharide monooxygenase-like protein [Polyangiaceae bacterium]|nr:SCE4755 family polysaccharide monooxygenase-like protein [Polyangiaceae bacterium]
MITRSILLTAITLLALTSTAGAHIQLVEPKARIPNDPGIKMGPCGGAVWGANGTTTFAPGQQITLKIVETISHDGAFRVAMDLDGDNDFTPMVNSQVFADFQTFFGGGTPANQLPAEVTTSVTEGNMLVLRNFYGSHPGGACPSGVMESTNGEEGCVWNISVTLPTQHCETCTLQVIQMMSEPGRAYGNGFYYHCADIKITGEPTDNTGGAGNTGGSSASAGGAASGGNSNGSGGVASSAGGAASATGGKSTGGAGPIASGSGGAKSMTTGGAPVAGTASPQGAGTEEDSGCGIAGRASSKWAWLAPLGLAALLARRARAKKHLS